jgi:hypothetical protein
MPRRIPTLGYKSRSEAVQAMHERGLGTNDIVSAVGINRNTVRVILCHERRGRARAPTRRTIVVSVDVLDALLPEAEARVVSVNELVRMLLDRIVDDSLVVAILDDSHE